MDQPLFKKLMETCQKGKMVYCFAPTCGHSSANNFQVLRFSKRYKAETTTSKGGGYDS